MNETVKSTCSKRRARRRERERERERERMRRRRKSQRVKIEELHTEACQRGDDTYIDPTTGLSVFTRLAHERRGKCCGCGCRHCPYRGNEVSSKNETQNIKTQNIETQNIEDIGEPKTKITSVYTKTGDKGESSLFNGERKHKSNATFDALGDIDELTANIGIAYEKCCKISKLGYDCHPLFHSFFFLKLHTTLLFPLPARLASNSSGV